MHTKEILMQKAHLSQYCVTKYTKNSKGSS